MPIVKSEDEVELINDTLKNTSLNKTFLDNSSLSTENELTCPICNETYCSAPRILSCLHVFCENCLTKKVHNENGTHDGQNIITCPVCNEVTKVGVQGVTSLTCNYMLMNLMELGIIKKSALMCTNCKSNEKAVARCVDCPHFLCSGCNAGHQYLRCYEKHYVLSLDEIKGSKEKIPLHKPIRCDIHKQLVSYFCISCQEPVCTDCTVLEHKSPNHTYERTDMAFMRERQKLETMVGEAKQKLDNCQEHNAVLENALRDLQSKYDHTKEHINETYENYKAILENCRDELLEDLSKVHSQQELKVMDAFQEIGKNIDHLNNTYNFTTRALEDGNEVEILSLKRLLSSQLTKLLSNNFSKPDTCVSLEFVTNYENFKYNVKIAFGHIRGAEKPTNNNIGGADNLMICDYSNQMHVSMVNGNNGTSARSSSSPVNSSPLSLPSSLDNELNYINLATTPQTPPPLEGLTTLGELNLVRLASLANGKKDSSLPAISTVAAESAVNGGTAGFSLNLLSPEGPFVHNIHALAQLGNSQLNDTDMINEGFNGICPNYASVMDNATMLDLTNDGSVMNGHMSVPPSPFFPHPDKYAGLNNSDMMSGLGAGGIEHQNYMGSFSRTSQRVNSLEIHFKFGQLGAQPGYFNSPHGFCVDDEDCIIVADTNNHRIQVFSKVGDFINQFGTPGKIDGQLWYPRKVELLPNGRYVICDRGNERSRLQLFSRTGAFIKKIRLKYVDIVAGMTITPDGQIVVVDSVQPSLYKLTENGDITFWIDCHHHMTEPSDVAVKDGISYICDFKGHSVAIFNEQGQFIKKMGQQGLTDYPNGIDIMSNGNILVGDSHGNKFHICIFSSNGDLICEYECPYVKVSRCCGLKLTGEGSIVTVAKNNNHVLVLHGPYM